MQTIKIVISDGTAQSVEVSEVRKPKTAVRCIDPYHVVQWTNEELDNARKRLASDIKKAICTNQKPGGFDENPTSAIRLFGYIESGII